MTGTVSQVPFHNVEDTELLQGHAWWGGGGGGGGGAYIY